MEANKLSKVRKTFRQWQSKHGSGAGYHIPERMSDVIMSVEATAGFYGTNLFHYFVSVLRYQKEVALHPEAFLPWNYLKTIAELEKKVPQHPKVPELTSLEWKKRKEGFANTKIKPFPIAEPNAPTKNRAPTSDAMIS